VPATRREIRWKLNDKLLTGEECGSLAVKEIIRKKIRLMIEV